MRLSEQMPDPGHGWVRYRPRSWPGAAELWLDLGTLGLGAGQPTELAGFDPAPLRELDDVLYLPPVGAEGAQPLQSLMDSLPASGPPILQQSLPGAGGPRSEGVHQVFDLLHAVATGSRRSLESLPPGSAVLWPLVSGYTDDPQQWRELLPFLAGRGVRHVYGLAADLSPAGRRQLVEVAGDRGYERLFHGPPPDPRSFAAAVRQVGLQPFWRRPLPTSPRRLAHNRRLAGVLLSIGDLWLRLERGEARGQGYFRAARWTDKETHDLVLLAREGNLGIVGWLDRQSRQVIEEVAVDDRSSLLDELETEYLDG